MNVCLKQGDGCRRRMLSLCVRLVLVLREKKLVDSVEHDTSKSTLAVFVFDGSFSNVADGRFRESSNSMFGLFR